MKQCKILIPLVLLLVVMSCRSHEIAYISDAQRDSAQAILDTYAVTILPGDQLYIYLLFLPCCMPPILPLSSNGNA